MQKPAVSSNRILITQAKAIVTCNAQDSCHLNSDMLIEDGIIRKIGKNLKVDGAETISAEGKILYPGLVNTHHHFFQTAIRNLITIDYPNLSVLDWIEQIYKLFSLVNEEVIYYSTLTAFSDLIKHGCTTALDHQYCFPRHAPKNLVDRQMEAAGMMGIRYHAARGANTLSQSRGSTVPDELVETTDEFLLDCERLITTWHDASYGSMHQIVVAPCQPINCKEETFIEAASLARKHAVQLHTHLGEGENSSMIARWGQRTLTWCRDRDFIGNDVFFAHGWELTPEEYILMAESGTGLAHCPAPAMLGGFPFLDIPAMQKAGMVLGLGVDGSATNDGSNLLDSLRMAYLMQANQSKVRGGAPTPYHLLEIATNGGVSLLGREDIGSLETGKAADLFMIDADQLELAGALHDPKNLLGKVGITGPVWLTMVAGKVVYTQGTLYDSSGAAIDERSLINEAEAVCNRIIRNPGKQYYSFSS